MISVCDRGSIERIPVRFNGYVGDAVDSESPTLCSTTVYVDYDDERAFTAVTVGLNCTRYTATNAT